MLVGELLKKKREESGRELRELSDILRIKYDYLKALEDGDFKRLPEDVYIKGYIRKYAELLHIDPDSAIDAYIQQVNTPVVVEVPSPQTMPRKSITVRRILIPSFLALTSILLMYILNFSPSEKENVSPPPVQMQNAIPTQQETTKEPLIGENNSVPPSPVVTENALPKQPAPSPKESRVPARSNLLLEVQATDTTWFLVTIDESTTQEMLMKPGESMKLEAEKSFSLKIGNAGGVKLSFNGKEVGKLGEKGEVITINFPDKKI